MVIPPIHHISKIPHPSFLVLKIPRLATLAPCLTSQWTNNEVTDDDEVTKEATKDVNMMVHCNPVADVKDETISASDTLRLIVYGNDWNEMIWIGR